MIDDSKYDIPGLNWLVSVLTEDVGWPEWVPMTEDEQAEFTKRTGSDYPFKVVRHPIPKTAGVIELEQGKFVVAFNNDRCKKLYLDLAMRYKEMEREYYRSMREMGAEKWQEATPQNTPCRMANGGAAGLCSAGAHSCLLTSPALRFVEMNGIGRGYFKCNGGGGGPDKPGTYYLVLGGKRIEIQPSHWRELPPSAPGEVKYEDVKDEVARIKKEAGRKEQR